MQAQHTSRVTACAYRAFLVACLMACSEPGELDALRFRRMRISIVSGDSQAMIAGAPYDNPFVVLVTDSAGVPQSGVPVAFFSASAYVKSIVPPMATTSSDGTARAIVSPISLAGGTSTSPGPLLRAYIAASPADTAGAPSAIFQAAPTLVQPGPVSALPPDTALALILGDTTRLTVNGTINGASSPVNAMRWTTTDSMVAKVVPAIGCTGTQFSGGWDFVARRPGTATIVGTSGPARREFAVTVSPLQSVPIRGPIAPAVGGSANRIIVLGLEFRCGETIRRLFDLSGGVLTEMAPPMSSASAIAITASASGEAFLATSPLSGLEIWRSPSSGVWEPIAVPAVRFPYVMATGGDGTTMLVGTTSSGGMAAFRWTGATWQDMSLPVPSADGLASFPFVAVVTASEAYVSVTPGSLGPFSSAPTRDVLYRWNGTSWSVVPLPADSGNVYSKRVALAGRAGASPLALIVDYDPVRNTPDGPVTNKSVAVSRLYRVTGTSFALLRTFTASMPVSFGPGPADGAAVVEQERSAVSRESAGAWQSSTLHGGWRAFTPTSVPTLVENDGSILLVASTLRGWGIVRVRFP